MAGIIDTIKLAGTLILAIPAALAGLDFLLIGDKPVAGTILLSLAVGLVVAQHWLTLPSDVPTALGQRLVGRVAIDPDDEREE